MKQSERTLKMKENFVTLRKEGLTPLEIADRYSVSYRTMYSCLSEIADDAGVTRESLLVTPGRGNHNGGYRSEPVAVNIAQDLAHFESVLTDLSSIRQALNNYLTTQEEISETLGKGIIV